jgi:hypothetical protein
VAVPIFYHLGRLLRHSITLGGLLHKHPKPRPRLDCQVFTFFLRGQVFTLVLC